MALRDIFFGTKEECDAVHRLFDGWRTKYSDNPMMINGLSSGMQDLEDLMDWLKYYAERWDKGEQSKILLSQTKKLLLAGNSERAEKLWNACLGGGRGWRSILMVAKEKLTR